MRRIFRYIATKEKKFDRLFGIIGAYGLFWFIFYGIFILLPEGWLMSLAEEAGLIMSIYFLVFVPILSFILPRYMVKHLGTKPWLTYLSHLLVIFLFLVLFFTLVLLRASLSIGPEDFV